jgi:D-glycero-alpha-D-manno-heptose 1-phosphate guanylyltransferase
MAPINGRPFLEYQLDYLQKWGVREVILAVGYMADSIKQHFGHCWNGINIGYSDEDKILGTGGAIVKAARMVSRGGGALVMNGDTFFPISIREMINNHNFSNASVSIAMFESEDIGRYSAFQVDTNMKITDINDPKSPLKSGGIYIFSPDVVDDFKKMLIQEISFETEIIPTLLAEGKTMVAFWEPCVFIDIGLPDDYNRAVKFVGTTSDNL